jgi:inorganic pyrophosphatase
MNVLVVAPLPVSSGCVVRCRPVGLLKMTDKKGGDAKLLAVPIKKECALYDHIESVEQMSKAQLNQIAHFFQHYKDLDNGKWVQLDGWGGADEARTEIFKAWNAITANVKPPIRPRAAITMRCLSLDSRGAVAPK